MDTKNKIEVLKQLIDMLGGMPEKMEIEMEGSEGEDCAVPANDMSAVDKILKQEKPQGQDMASKDDEEIKKARKMMQPKRY